MIEQPIIRLRGRRLIKTYRTFTFRFWRLSIQRWDPLNSEISVLWRDNTKPPVYNTLFKIRECPHRTLRHFDLGGDDIECEVCIQCAKQFNYRQTDRWKFINFLWDRQIEETDRLHVTVLARRLRSKEHMRETLDFDRRNNPELYWLMAKVALDEARHSKSFLEDHLKLAMLGSPYPGEPDPSQPAPQS